MNYISPKGMIPLKFTQVQHHCRQYRNASEKNYTDAEEWITKNMNYTEVKVRKRYYFFGDEIVTRISKTRTSYEARKEWENSYRANLFNSMIQFGCFLSIVERTMIEESIDEVFVDVDDFNNFNYCMKTILSL